MSDGSGLGDIIGGALGLFGSIYSADEAAQSVASTNAQNMMMNTGAWKAQQVATEASRLGVSPLAVLGNTGTNVPMQSVSGPDLAPALSKLGQGLGRSVQGENPADQRMAALKEQEQVLRNMALENDVVAGQTRNSLQRVAFNAATPPARPASFTLDDVWQSVHGPSELAPKAIAQAFMRPDRSLVYGPSAAVQQSLWSPLPGLPANPQVIADITRLNAGHMPPDVARMAGGLPWGAYPFVEGTAPSFYDRYLRPETEGRDDPDIYGR